MEAYVELSIRLRLDDLYQKRIRAEQSPLRAAQRHWLLSDIDYEIDGLEEELALAATEEDRDDRSCAA